MFRKSKQTYMIMIPITMCNMNFIAGGLNLRYKKSPPYGMTETFMIA